MIKVVANWLLAANLLIWCSAYAGAETADSDKAEYLSHCAECHGLDGKGTGPRASKLKTKPSDLTLFAKKNNGVFPFTQLYSSIDGRYEIESHETDDSRFGVADIPHLTLDRLRPNAPKVFKPDPYEPHLDLACDFADTIAARIMSVINYLRRIQDK
jgi:hypothetical protein